MFDTNSGPNNRETKRIDEINVSHDSDKRVNEIGQVIARANDDGSRHVSPA